MTVPRDTLIRSLDALSDEIVLKDKEIAELQQRLMEGNQAVLDANLEQVGFYLPQEGSLKRIRDMKNEAPGWEPVYRKRPNA